MKIKKIILLLCCLTTLTTYPQQLSLDEIGFDDFLSDEPADYSQEIEQLVHQTRLPSCEFSTQNLVTLAVTGNVLPALLQFNAYKFTHPPVIRNLHDLPSLRPWYGCDDALCMYGTLFYNQMFHANFTKCGTHITDYLNVAEDDALIGELESLIPFVPEVLPLFNQARLQQRRLGIMLGASKCFGNLRFNVAVPLFYQELNFYLTQDQVDALNGAAFFGADQPIPIPDNPQNEGFSVFDPNTFIERHLLSDKVGLGDIRLYLDYMLFDDTCCPVRLGGQVTLPNNTVIRHSILGSNFDKCYPGPGLSFNQLLTLQCISDQMSDDPLILQAKNDLAALGQSYALQFLDRLSSTVIQNSLGQRQVSYGFLGEAFVALTNYTNLCVFFEWDQFVKGHEDRAVRLAITPSESLERDYTNPALAQDNLTFLQQRLINILFPPIANLTVKQGDIIKARFYTQTNWRVFQWNVGYDLWYQDKERVLTCNTCALPTAQLDIKTAGKPAALQGKIFGGFNVQRHPEYYETFGWRAGLKGEATVNNYGIGKDWLVGMDFVADF